MGEEDRGINGGGDVERSKREVGMKIRGQWGGG